MYQYVIYLLFTLKKQISTPFCILSIYTSLKEGSNFPYLFEVVNVDYVSVPFIISMNVLPTAYDKFTSNLLN